MIVLDKDPLDERNETSLADDLMYYCILYTVRTSVYVRLASFADLTTVDHFLPRNDSAHIDTIHLTITPFNTGLPLITP